MSRILGSLCLVFLAIEMTLAGFATATVQADEEVAESPSSEEVELERPDIEADRLQSRSTREGLAATSGMIRVITYDNRDPSTIDLETWEPLIFVVENYGLECGGSIGFIFWNPDAPIKPPSEDELFPQIEKFEDPIATYFKCDVEPGHEDTWIEILTKAELIWAVDLVPEEWASSSEGVLLPKLFPSSTNRALQGLASSEELLSRVSLVLSEFYGTEAEIISVKETSKRLRVVVENIQGRIVKSESYWERLEIDAIAVVTEPQTTLVLVIDGYFASGSKRTKRRRYADLSADYQEDLDIHLGELSTRIRKSYKDAAR